MSENMERGIFDGVEGESLFHKPFIGEQLNQENYDLIELFQKVEKMEDHRLLSVVTALLIESRIDKINWAFFPNYKKLLESANFTFSVKILLLEATNLLPPVLTRSAHVLRKIRNEFAHNLEKVRFKDLEDKYLTPLDTIVLGSYPGEKAGLETEEETLYKFKKVSFLCIAGLDSYVGNVAVLRSEISRKEFLDPLYERDKEVLKAFREEVDAAFAKADLSSDE